MDTPKKILIVDDDSFFSSIISNSLRKHGYEVLSARDGASGIETARKERPDLILMDMAMTGMDGFEALTNLKKDAATANIPVVIFSGSAGSSDKEKQERAKKAGALAYLEKMQFTPEQLRERIEQYLET